MNPIWLAWAGRERESVGTLLSVCASRLQSLHLAPSLLVVVGNPRLLLWRPHGARLSEVRVHWDAMLLSHLLWLWVVLVVHLGSMNKHGSLPLCVRLRVASSKVVQLQYRQTTNRPTAEIHHHTSCPTHHWPCTITNPIG